MQALQYAFHEDIISLNLHRPLEADICSPNIYKKEMSSENIWVTKII